MSHLNINIDNHGQKYTVHEMRRRLAQVLSKLNGNQLVTFAFRAELPEYEPAPLPGTVMGELARPSND